MNLLIQGTNAFNDYNVFMRAMAVALSDTKSELKITSIGGYRINQMVREFVNVSENGLRSRGVSIRLRLEPPTIPLDGFDKMFYFCNNGDKLSRVGQKFRQDGVFLVFRY